MRDFEYNKKGNKKTSKEVSKRLADKKATEDNKAILAELEVLAQSMGADANADDRQRRAMASIKKEGSGF